MKRILVIFILFLVGGCVSASFESVNKSDRVNYFEFSKVWNNWDYLWFPNLNNCLNFDSFHYLNTSDCEQVEFQFITMTQDVKPLEIIEFVNEIAKMVCRNPKVNFNPNIPRLLGLFDKLTE